jgi:hypothetical protein
MGLKGTTWVELGVQAFIGVQVEKPIQDPWLVLQYQRFILQRFSGLPFAGPKSSLYCPHATSVSAVFGVLHTLSNYDVASLLWAAIFELLNFPHPP